MTILNTSCLPTCRVETGVDRVLSIDAISSFRKLFREVADVSRLSEKALVRDTTMLLSSNNNASRTISPMGLKDLFVRDPRISKLLRLFCRLTDFPLGRSISKSAGDTDFA